MTKKRRHRIWLSAGGLCAKCDAFSELDGCEIDHEISWWISHDDTDDNLRVLCLDCHRKIKTPQDAGVIAKVKRLIARQDGTRRERPVIKSQGFNKRLRRRMDGTTVKRGDT